MHVILQWTWDTSSLQTESRTPHPPSPPLHFSSSPVAGGPLELPLFQLIPTQRQLVFHGDRLPLQCTASYLDQSVKLRWLHDGRDVTTLEDGGVYVEETLLHDCCLLTRYSQPGSGLLLSSHRGLETLKHHRPAITGQPSAF